MQTAVHTMAPQLLPQYSHSSLNRPLNGNSTGTGMPTPPATRKRKRATHQYTVSYSEVQEVDSAGKVRDVIVIDDTPPPATASPSTSHMFSASYQPPLYSAPIRTRARAAQEAQALSASVSSTTIAGPVAKKRRRDIADDAGTVAKRPATGHLQQLAANKSIASGSGATVDEVLAGLLLDLRACTESPVRPRRTSLATTKRATTSLYPTTSSTVVVGTRLTPDWAIMFTFHLDRTVRLLGQGTFGKVVEAVDTETNKRVAIKIIRAIPKYRDASKMEVRVLQKLKERDPRNLK